MTDLEIARAAQPRALLATVEGLRLTGSAIAGTGKDGRVTKGDVIAHLERPQGEARPSPAAARSTSSSTRKSSPARK